MAAGDTMQGVRVEDVPDPHESHPRLNPGEYRRTKINGELVWECCTPNGEPGNLRSHGVVEHDDGTITVSPSILVSRPPDNRELWHGFLERGVWREV